MHFKRRLAQIPTIRLLGVRIHVLPLEMLLDLMMAAIRTDSRLLIGNVNVHAMNVAWRQPEFRNFLNEANVVFCDGFGVRLAARILGKPVPYRYTPPDWLPDLCTRCLQDDASLFLLGARPGVADEAASRLVAQFPRLRIAGTYHGYFDKSPDSAENAAVRARINAVQPDVLLVGFGMPLQELWLRDNWCHLDVNVALSCGALFDYVADRTPRPPEWMRQHGFEWLGRLIIEPRRLWRRYLIGNPLFLWRVLRQRLRDTQ